jgi:serine/threonine protein kinase
VGLLAGLRGFFVGLLEVLGRIFGGGSKSSSPARPKKGKKPKPPPPKPVKPKAKADPPLPRVDIKKRFSLENRIGQGSMSKVWRARDRNTGRIVCLKILDKLKTDKFEARFPGLNKPKEGTIASRLHHPNIVQTYDIGITYEGEPFIAMEFVDGVGLNYLVETRSPRLEGNRIQLLKQMADALEHMHSIGYLHRDICPRNVMVTNDNVVKLIDFGLSIPNTGDFLKPGNRTGTPNFLAPELIRRRPTDHRVDLFALGVTAYNLFTYNMPWEVKGGASFQVLISKMGRPGKDPREFCPDMDDATRRFLLHAIEREPEARFQSAAKFRDAMLTLPPQ